MSTHSGPSPTAPTSAVRNTVGREKEMPQGNINGPASDVALKEYCDKHYNQLLPILAEKMHQEKVQQKKLKAVKARLNFEEVSQHSELGTPSKRRNLRKRLGSRRIRSVSESPKPTRDRSESPRKRDPKRKTVFKRPEKGVFHRLGDKGKTISAYSSDSRRQSCHNSHKDTESCYQSSRSRGTDFAPKKHHNTSASSRRMEVLSESEGSAGGHWKSRSKKQRLSIEDDDLFQPWQKKCIKDPVEIHHIKQREGESTKDFVRRFKIESRDVKGAPEVMRISGFPELIKRLHDKIPKSVDEMMKITTSFLRGELAAVNQERKKSLPPCKQQEAGHKQNFKKGCFKNQHRSERRQDIFTLLSKSPKKILALEKGKFKTPPPMNTPVEKRNNNKFCEFHGEVGHNTDECMHLKRRIEEFLKNGKLLHVIKELKQNSGKDQPKTNKKGETSNKDKALAILMVQPWQRVARQRITQSFSPNPEISFPPLEEEEGTEGPMIIEAEIRGHFIHRIYVDGGSASKILYEHCFNKLRLEIKNQMVPAMAPLIGFSGEIIWPLGANITTGENWRWGTFNLGLDELCDRGILTLKSSKIIPIECAAVSGPEGQPPTAYQAIEERIKPVNMTGVPRHIAEYRLNIWEGCPPVKQKRRSQAADRNQAIQEEVKKLVDADFKDLNKVCPKDGYPLPELDWRVESLCGFPFNAFWMHTRMPFGLRNAGATYQRLVDKAFHKQIGMNLEVYVDDLVIKNCSEEEIVRDIKETFKTLREINMKLNLKKCTFGVEEGMFLGYKVNTKRIKVCPDKVDAVLSLPSPKCLKDVQNLNGKLASLNRFLAKSIEKSLLFFKTLKRCTKKSDFHWIKEAESAFKQMKQLIAKLPTLITQEEKEELIVYLATSKEAVSVVVMSEREAKQMPIYFVSRALRGPEVNYTSMEKLVLVLVHTSKRLKRYFQAHPIIVITDQPIKQVLSRPEVAGRFEATNNEAEYKALIAGLRITEEMGVKNLQAHVDSRLVANQVNGKYITKEADMIRYLEKVPYRRNSPSRGTRSVVAKALRTGYYWPTMHKDARALIRAYQDCQVHRPVLRNPQQKLTPIMSPWPFYK
ncbi:reverse transcriptase domain-containing protein [Tanacetum coccineum]|uniref:Reverse transcriptase domain-containing protein n=1 Tax=Tanacetum coccineum TaxID=301880 RepID=A0ABQ5DDR7_9ASTR